MPTELREMAPSQAYIYKQLDKCRDMSNWSWCYSIFNSNLNRQYSIDPTLQCIAGIPVGPGNGSGFSLRNGQK